MARCDGTVDAFARGALRADARKVERAGAPPGLPIGWRRHVARFSAASTRRGVSAGRRRRLREPRRSPGADAGGACICTAASAARRTMPMRRVLRDAHRALRVVAARACTSTRSWRRRTPAPRASDATTRVRFAPDGAFFNLETSNAAKKKSHSTRDPSRGPARRARAPAPDRPPSPPACAPDAPASIAVRASCSSAWARRWDKRFSAARSSRPQWARAPDARPPTASYKPAQGALRCSPSAATPCRDVGGVDAPRPMRRRRRRRRRRERDNRGRSSEARSPAGRRSRVEAARRATYGAREEPGTRSSRGRRTPRPEPGRLVGAAACLAAGARSGSHWRDERVFSLRSAAQTRGRHDGRSSRPTSRRRDLPPDGLAARRDAQVARGLARVAGLAAPRRRRRRAAPLRDLFGQEARLGVSDYAALLARYDVVCVDTVVPTFAAEKDEDALRRFVLRGRAARKQKLESRARRALGGSAGD